MTIAKDGGQVNMIVRRLESETAVSGRCGTGESRQSSLTNSLEARTGCGRGVYLDSSQNLRTRAASYGN
jgi:hypothetical protein